MALKVVGAGFGRTGTLSLKNALEKLGFGPCYHMLEVIERPDHIEMWHRLAFGGSMDWDLLFKDFQSTVDWPAAHYWRKLADHYPDAKVLLSLRDPQSWYKSMSDTIFQGLKITGAEGVSHPRQQQGGMARKIIVEDTFGGRIDDKGHAIEVYNRHNETVRRTIPPERLLVFEARDGWEPLCRFLNVSIPQEPFPHLNDTASMLERMKQMRTSGRV